MGGCHCVGRESEAGNFNSAKQPKNEEDHEDHLMQTKAKQTFGKFSNEYDQDILKDKYETVNEKDISKFKIIIHLENDSYIISVEDEFDYQSQSNNIFNYYNKLRGSPKKFEKEWDTSISFHLLNRN